jgi:hypothetical protein
MLSSPFASSAPPRTTPWPRITFSFGACVLLCLSLLLQPLPTSAIKFNLQSYRFPPPKCIWNAAHPDTLVIVTANVGPGESQRVDIEIIDSSSQKNVYLRKKDIKGETRLAVTTLVEGEVGVCFRNYMDSGARFPVVWFDVASFVRLQISHTKRQKDCHGW